MTTPADGRRPRMRMFLWIELDRARQGRTRRPRSPASRRPAPRISAPQAFDLTGDLVLALDAADTDGPTTTDGCTPFANAAAVAGRIAVIDRGTCLFVVKAKNAQNAGAAGVLIVNNVEPGCVSAWRATDATITLPRGVDVARRRHGDQGAARARERGEHAHGAQERASRATARSTTR